MPDVIPGLPMITATFGGITIVTDQYQWDGDTFVLYDPKRDETYRFSGVEIAGREREYDGVGIITKEFTFVATEMK